MRRRWSGVVVIFAAAAACKFTAGGAPTQGIGDGPRPDTTTPPDVAPDIALGPCTAAGDTCLSDGLTIESCTGAGANPTSKSCSWGCTQKSTGVAACGKLTPAGGWSRPADTDPGTLQGLPSVVIGPGSATIQSDGMILGAVSPASGWGKGNHNGVAYLQFKQLTIMGPATVTLTGGMSIALVSDGAIDISGAIDARGCTGAGPKAGPGGFNGGGAGGNANGSGAGQGGGADDDGGGGGGHGGMGGTGNGGHNGGPAFPDAIISVLVGGGGGGGGKNSMGGGGGGALQLVSNTRITFEIGSLINAGGCGGPSGGGGGGNPGGGGGGAGGTILLEAPAISISGALAVNGGGGGGANAAGQAGRPDRMPANGAGGGGGNGAAATITDGTSGNGNGAAGGGAIGRIRINTRNGANATVDPASPFMSPNLNDNTTATAGSATVTFP